MEYSITKGINIHEYTVSELNKAIQGTLEGKFENIRVRGEISGLNKAASGHVYLSLKDNDSIISAVIWSSKLNQFNFIPEDGMEVLVDGNIKTWAPASKYQIIINIEIFSGINHHQQSSPISIKMDLCLYILIKNKQDLLL